MRINDIVIGEQYADLGIGGGQVEAVRFVEVKKGEYTDAKVRAVELRRHDGELVVRRGRELEPWAVYDAHMAKEGAEYERDQGACDRLNDLLAQAGIETTFTWTVEGFVVDTNAEALEVIEALLTTGLEL